MNETTIFNLFKAYDLINTIAGFPFKVFAI